MTLVLCHLGGGISTSLHQNGRIVDGFATDEGTFTPRIIPWARASISILPGYKRIGAKNDTYSLIGRLPLKKLVKLCMSGDYDKKEINAMLTGKAGLIGYLGTNDCREIEARIQQGDKNAELVYHAMAYQIAKDIGYLHCWFPFWAQPTSTVHWPMHPLQFFSFLWEHNLFQTIYQHFPCSEAIRTLS